MLAKRPQKKTYGGFQKYWYPQIIHFNRVFHYKPSVLGYPYFRKHPYPKLPTTKLSAPKDITPEILIFNTSAPERTVHLWTYAERMGNDGFVSIFFVGENNNAFKRMSASLEWTLVMLEQGSFRVSGARLELVKFQRKRWLSLGYQHQKNGEP